MPTLDDDVAKAETNARKYDELAAIHRRNNKQEAAEAAAEKANQWRQFALSRARIARERSQEQ